MFPSDFTIQETLDELLDGRINNLRRNYKPDQCPLAST